MVNRNVVLEKMAETKKGLTGKKLAAISLSAIVIVAVVISVWWYYIRPGSPTIKIGVIGPMKLIQGTGMKEGAILAAEEINNAGGVLVNKTTGEHRNIALYYGDEGTVPAEGASSMQRLLTVDGVDFLAGGFRTEIVYAMREIAMDNKKIFLITGAATNELLDEVWTNYPRYKYMFRVLPLNSTMLFNYGLVPFVKFYLLSKLGGTTQSPIKIAAVVENLAWTDYLWNTIIVQNPTLLTGLNATLPSELKFRPSHMETDFTPILSTIRASGAKLIVHVFSGEAGLAISKQWGEMQIPAVLLGINVLSQESEMWNITEGKCEYEAFISTPPRANITEKTIPFWDKYVQRWGHTPIYTSFGEYDAIHTLAEAIERAGTMHSDNVVAELEKTDRLGLIGRFKFTGRTHDVFCQSTYRQVIRNRQWVTEWVRTEYPAPLIVQWRSPGTKQPVFPFNQTYSVAEFKLPPWMTP